MFRIWIQISFDLMLLSRFVQSLFACSSLFVSFTSADCFLCKRQTREIMQMFDWNMFVIRIKAFWTRILSISIKPRASMINKLLHSHPFETSTSSRSESLSHRFFDQIQWNSIFYSSSQIFLVKRIDQDASSFPSTHFNDRLTNDHHI